MLTVFPALACIVASTVAMAVGCALPAGTGVMDAARAGSRAQRGHRPRFELFVTGTNVAVVAAATRTVTIEAIVADRACILDTERPDLARLAGPRAQCGRRPSVELLTTGAHVAVVLAATRAVVIEALLAHRACILDAGRPDLARLAGPRAIRGRGPIIELPPARPLPAELFRFAVIIVIFFVALRPTS